MGRFLNADDTDYLGASGTVLSYNLYSYCNNNIANYVDLKGTSPFQAILAAIFGVVGFVIGDYIARGCGLAPSGKDAWKYWTLRSAVAVGGIALGWFAGALIIKLMVKYLSGHPEIMLKIAAKYGSKFLINALNFFGINPIGLMNKSLLMGFLQTVFNNPKVIISSAWVRALLQAAQKYGWNIRLDPGHKGTAWNFIHLHIGKVHIAIKESVVSIIKSFIGG